MHRQVWELLSSTWKKDTKVLLELKYDWKGRDETMLQESHLQIRVVTANEVLNALTKEMLPLVRREIAMKQNKFFSLPLILGNVRKTMCQMMAAFIECLFPNETESRAGKCNMNLLRTN